MGALTRDAELFRDVSNRAMIPQNAFNKQQPAVIRQSGINVRQENFLAVDDLDISTKPGGSPISQDPKCHQRHGRVQLGAGAQTHISSGGRGSHAVREASGPARARAKPGPPGSSAPHPLLRGGTVSRGPGRRSLIEVGAMYPSALCAAVSGRHSFNVSSDDL